MFKEVLTQTMSQLGSELGYSIKKHGPTMLLVGGLGGIIGGTILACRATLKAKPVVEEAAKEIEEIHEDMQGFQTDEGTIIAVPADEAKKALTKVYVRTGLELVKLYAPAVIVEGLGIAGVVSSHKMLNDRYIGAAAACTVLTRDFNEYRKRVAKRFGAAVEEDICKGREEVEETVTDEKGKKKKVKKKVQTERELALSNLDREFDCRSNWWSDNHELGIFGVRTVQKMLIERLKLNGCVFLNEVYDAFGWARTKAGNIYGWYYDRNDPHKYPPIDFGITDPESTKAFLSYDTDTLRLKFNCIDILSGLEINERIDDAEPEVA